MEALGAASALISVTQLTGKVINLLYDYQRGSRHAASDILSIKRELKELRSVLESLEELSASTESSNHLKLLDRLESPLQICQERLQELEVALSSKSGRLNTLGKALTWPLKEKEVKKNLGTLAQQRSILHLALTADQMAISLATQEGVTRSEKRLKDLDVAFKEFTTSDRMQNILCWLNAPDPSTNHNHACKAKQPKTGTWLLESSEYRDWKVESGSMLWLHGIPGCGKTVLSSTIIEELIAERWSQPQSSLLFFYFDFNDDKKRKVDGLIRTLIAQLVPRRDQYPLAIDALYERCSNGQKQPSLDILITTLRGLLQDTTETFIVLDALDECTELWQLTSFITDIVGWNISGLHMLCTSRGEKQIEDCFDGMKKTRISVQNPTVDADIALLVDEKLRNDPSLCQWSTKVKGEIKTALLQGSQGMFRWAVCQLEALARCFKVSAVRQALDSLPRTLDKTYERIVNNIDDENMEDALKIFRWLIFSDRPLRVKELAEAVAISLRERPSFSLEDRLRHPTDLLRICSSLVSLHHVGDDNNTPVEVIDLELRLAHYSVREYLVSNWKSLAETPSQLFLAESCLVYILHVTKTTIISETKVDATDKSVLVDENYPLCAYAARYWPGHAVHTHGILRTLIEQLFTSPIAFKGWIHLYDPDNFISNQLMKYTQRVNPRKPGTPLYYASLLGFYDIVDTLLKRKHGHSIVCGKYGTAVGAAAAEGHDDILTLLRRHGASIEASAGVFKNALHAAISRGSLDCTRLLVAFGSDVNKDLQGPGSFYTETPLLIAAEEGHLEIVKFILTRDVDTSVQGYYGDAVQTALSGGHDDVVQFLLSQGMKWTRPRSAAPKSQCW